MENSTKEERKMIDSEYTRLVLDENRNNLEENDETIVAECIVNILHKENNNLGIRETNIEKKSHSDGNNKIDENERASSTTHQQENAPLETSTEEENNLPNENKNKKYNMSQVALSSRENVSIEKIWEKHLKWPEFEKKEQKEDQKVNQEPNSLKKNLPYAITSSKWKHYYELIKREQEEKERKAAERLVKQNIKKEAVEAAKAEKRKARTEKAREKEEKENIKKESFEVAKAEKRKARAEKAKEKEEKAEMKKKRKLKESRLQNQRHDNVQLKKRP